MTEGTLDGVSAVESYRAQAAALAIVADQVLDWSLPSPCVGWSALDVLDHVIDSQRDYLDRKLIDLGPRPVGDPALVWRAHAETVLTRLVEPELLDDQIDGVFGPTTISETLATFYGFDMVVHRWDVAVAAGLPATFTEDELELIRASLLAFGEAIYADGVCAPALPVAEDADEQTRLLAALGRIG